MKVRLAVRSPYFVTFPTSAATICSNSFNSTDYVLSAAYAAITLCIISPPCPVTYKETSQDSPVPNEIFLKCCGTGNYRLGSNMYDFTGGARVPSENIKVKEKIMSPFARSMDLTKILSISRSDLLRRNSRLG